MARNAKPRLLQLPAELRNKIYGHAIDGRVQSVSYGKYPGLLVACKQIYYEATPIFYERTIFYVGTHCRCLAWLRKLPRQRRQQIREIRYTTISRPWGQGRHGDCFRRSDGRNAIRFLLSLTRNLDAQDVFLHPTAIKVPLYRSDDMLVWTSTPCELMKQWAIGKRFQT